MSINDPLIVKYDPKRELYYVTRGRETFYDEERSMIMFDTLEAAKSFAEAISALDGSRVEVDVD